MSKVDKRIKNARLALERAHGRGASDAEIARHQKMVDKYETLKGLHKASHDGRA